MIITKGSWFFKSLLLCGRGRRTWTLGTWFWSGCWLAQAYTSSGDVEPFKENWWERPVKFDAILMPLKTIQRNVQNLIHCKQRIENIEKLIPHSFWYNFPYYCFKDWCNSREAYIQHTYCQPVRIKISNYIAYYLIKHGYRTNQWQSILYYFENPRDFEHR